MNKVSRLAALLLAVLLFAFAGCALAEEVDVDLAVDGGAEDVVYTGGTEVEGSVDYIQVTALYGKLVNAADLKEMYDTLHADGNFDLLYNMSAEQLQAMNAHAEALFAAIENPTADEIDWHEEVVTIFAIVAEDLEISLYVTKITDDYTFAAGTHNISAITIKSEDGANTDANWEMNSGAVLVVNGTITVPKNETLDIYIKPNQSTSATATIKAGSNLTGAMFDVQGRLKIGWANGGEAESTGTIIIEGGKINLQSGSTLRVDRTGSVSGEWALASNSQVYMYQGITVPDGKTLTISGSGQIDSCLNENDTNKNLLTIADGGKLIANGVIIDGKNTDATAIRCHEDLDFDNVVIKNFHRKGSSGAISITGATDANAIVTLDNCTIKDCKANAGTAIYLEGAGAARVTLTKVIIDNCDSNTDAARTDFGGGIRTNGNGKFVLLMDQCVVRNCWSHVFGAGVYWNASGAGSSITIKDCHFLNNDAEERGAAIFLEGSNSTITASAGTRTPAVTGGIPSSGIIGTLIQGNKANDAGGGICFKCYANSEEIQIPNTEVVFAQNVVIRENESANGAGVAFMLDNTNNYPNGAKFKFTINGAEIENNTATNNGAGIYVRKGRQDYKIDVNLESGIVQNNDAANGGAIAVEVGNSSITTGGNFTMSGGTLKNNTATGNGGGIYLTKGNYTMSGGTVENNHAVNGGASYVTGGDFAMSGGTMSSNYATANGGAVYVTGGSFSMSGGTINGNGKNAEGTVTTVNGGAVYVTGSGVEFTMSNGTLTDNHATTNGGAVVVDGGSFEITGTGAFTNNSAINGGAVYVSGGNFTMKDGTMTGNGKNGDTVVAGNGGAVYVTGTNSNFTMEKGTFTNNVASNYGGAVVVDGGSFEITDFGTFTGHSATKGGAVYVSNGGFEMEDGLLDDNEAFEDGGAVYVTGGSFTMYDGDLTNNEAVNGGAAYVTGTGSGFTMISGSMKNNTVEASSAAAAESGSEGYGGALYIKGGDVYIGVDGCTGEGENHSNNYTNKEHPVIENNTAEFGGAMAVSGGSVYVYCGDVIKNNSDNRGTGENVFMDNGAFHHYLESSNIGEKEDHGMVSIGGELTIHHGTDQQFIITIRYFANTDNDLGEGVKAEWQGTAPKDYHLNLPYCPQTWRDAQNGLENPLTFTGWVQSQDGTQPDKIRAKDNYSPIGTPVQIEDMSSDGSKEMYFYAVWAPKYNPITYAYTLNGTDIFEPLDYTGTGTIKRNGKDHYEFNMTSDTVDIGAPSKAGYAFRGWRVYATKEHISNWDADATSYPVTQIAQIKSYSDYIDYNGVDGAKPNFIDTNSYLLSNQLKTQQNFGDLVLVAVFDPMFSTLKITKDVNGTLEENASFLFHITGTPDDDGLGYNTNNPYSMYVTVNGIGTTTIEEIPVGDYTVTEISDWSWRYNSPAAVKLDITNPDEDYTAAFTNGNRKAKWLDGEAVAEENQFTVNSGN